ncbi:MarR family winged helix-turn-helix transcriptional regulator [Tautonia plasticadhaerens]|uniref:MarR family protein n=1 Tax=Tautonia plasticadhaerens TaxID=2527974 RepID=A0A518GWB3_9BACT|nr:MarR family winged helix-turn-helix transcriptional regulator [Tautonia plasticadhaerens]QDV32890.1 MarR family protein [Tautonia plasticadhaerens]
MAVPCMCGVLRQASRAVTRVYDDELRGAGLRATQYTLLRLLERSGEVRQRDLGGLASIDETTLTRNLRPLMQAGWVSARAGEDRREKLVAITEAGRAKVGQAGSAWQRAQDRLRGALPEETWDLVLRALPSLTGAAAEASKSGEGT